MPGHVKCKVLCNTGILGPKSKMSSDCMQIRYNENIFIPVVSMFRHKLSCLSAQREIQCLACLFLD